MSFGLDADRLVVGMSCAHHLSEHPEKFDVTLIDAVDYCGGQAFSIPINKEKHGASWLNQGVQGGSNIFHHTMTMFARQGHHADPVKLQVRDDSNILQTELNKTVGIVWQRRCFLDERLSNPASRTTRQRDQTLPYDVEDYPLV